MSKLVVSQFITVDGVIEDPGGAEAFERGGWAFRYDRGADGDAFKMDEVMASDALLLGRVTYEGFAAAWPSREGEFADKFNSMRKYVVSSTLREPGWNNTTVIRDDLAGRWSELKQQPGGDILVNGSIQLVADAGRARPGGRVPADGVPGGAGRRPAPVRGAGCGRGRWGWSSRGRPARR